MRFLKGLKFSVGLNRLIISAWWEVMINAVTPPVEMFDPVWRYRRKLTSSHKEEEFGVSRQADVFRQRVLRDKLALVLVRVSDPQLRDGHVHSVVARVSGHAGAVPVAIVVHAELAHLVHKQHVRGSQPAAFQVHAKGRGVSSLKHTRKKHRIALEPLQELNVTVDWTQTHNWTTVSPRGGGPVWRTGPCLCRTIEMMISVIFSEKQLQINKRVKTNIWAFNRNHRFGIQYKSSFWKLWPIYLYLTSELRSILEFLI